MTTIKLNTETFKDTIQKALADVQALKVGDFYKGALEAAKDAGYARNTPLWGLYVSTWTDAAFDRGIMTDPDSGLIVAIADTDTSVIK